MQQCYGKPVVEVARADFDIIASVRMHIVQNLRAMSSLVRVSATRTTPVYISGILNIAFWEGFQTANDGDH